MIDPLYAWKGEYVGETEELLKTAISSMYKESLEGQKAWKNFCAIFQGSGTGKSRLVDKLAESVFTIPLVLRPTQDRGHPPGDTGGPYPPHVFFSKEYPCEKYESVDRITRRYLLFMLKTISFARDWINDYLKAGHGAANIAADWRKYLGPPRSPNRESMHAKACDRSIPEEFEDIFSIPEDAFIEVIAKRVERFIKTVSQNISHDTESNPSIVFYFDEAQHLIENTVTRRGQTKRTAYQCLCRAFTYMYRAPVFGLFIGAYSQLCEFTPAPNYWSSRPFTPLLDERDDNINAPFVELPFDLWKEPNIVTEGTHTAEDICSLKFMARFGRPLFWTLTDIRGEYTAMLTAESKLRLKSLYDICDIYNPEGAIIFMELIPLLAARVDFTLESNRTEAIHLDKLLVTNAMRTVYSVPQHRQYLCSGYPSEPFLAEAAARMLFKHFHSDLMEIKVLITKYEDDVPSAVKRWFSQGLIDQGRRESLVARVLCTLAHDIAILKMVGRCDRKISFSEMVPVIKFLKALIGEDLINDVLAARPANLKGDPLKDVFKNAYVHFTQFSKASNKFTITEETAYLLFTRGAAIQGYGKLPAEDLVLPIWICGDDDAGNPDRWHMTAMFIQVGNDSVFNEEQFESFTQTEGDKRPYITMAMHLVGTPEKDQVPPHSESATTQFPPRTSSAHPRYEISLEGCSSSVYNVISEKSESSYSTLLADRGMLPEHPRGGKFLAATKRMKPFWEPESFDWANMNSEGRSQAARDNEDLDERDVTMDDSDENEN
ncbi:hypothetical protein AGABI2DRAFT_180798 [Agaricus bisporus var. bisporus H97]|uniref:hypothetical protein n=1 Tax=Agaricus bisporus var. bisporus (strain H97 / ATCC MYA-4626 / FGSC 10389) TaxID=936046 RepID=UPI00029F5344|nr:hypothetical protein AGABI2DRAFT_180798 [Agaricus bisporus var. bisporus H97]EKV43000.1 hypothetical protein AGABI2DRAFT_180798 [Agaricus bisporus var. bisporus H97]